MLQTRVGQAHGRGGVPDRRPARRRAADHAGRGAAAGHRRAAGAADVPAVRPGRRSGRCWRKGMAASPGAAVGCGRVRLRGGGGPARGGRVGGAGAPGDQPGRPRGHDRRERGPDQPGRQDQPRRGGGPRAWAAPACAGSRRSTSTPRAHAPGSGTSSINEGDVIAIDGSTGEVFLGDVPVVTSPVADYLEHGLDTALADADEETAELVQAVDRILAHADATRRLRVRANADTAEDAARARRLGAQGIGLCRTEHMFLGDRRVLIERLVLADAAEARSAALEALLPLQREDFVELFDGDGRAAGDHPAARPAAARVPARPHRAGGQGRRRHASAARTPPRTSKLLAAVERLHESNPMLGLRGVRLGLTRAGPVRAAGPRHRRGRRGADQGRRRPAGGDHGAAGRVGDGAAPDPRRGRRRAGRGGRARGRRAWTSRSAR